MSAGNKLITSKDKKPVLFFLHLLWAIHNNWTFKSLRYKRKKRRAGGDADKQGLIVSCLFWSQSEEERRGAFPPVYFSSGSNYFLSAGSIRQNAICMQCGECSRKCGQSGGDASEESVQLDLGSSRFHMWWRKKDIERPENTKYKAFFFFLSFIFFLLCIFLKCCCFYKIFLYSCSQVYQQEIVIGLLCKMLLLIGINSPSVNITYQNCSV